MKDKMQNQSINLKEKIVPRKDIEGTKKGRNGIKEEFAKNGFLVQRQTTFFTSNRILLPVVL
jgi:hypothetical protein